MAAVRLFSPQNGRGPLLVKDVIAAYLTHSQTASPAEVYANSAKILDAFSVDFGHLPVTEARAFQLQAWVSQHKAWKSNWTKKRAGSTVRGAFGWAAKLGMIDSNPYCGVSFPRGERGYPVTPEQFRSMLRCTSALFRRVLTFLHYTGCRPGEMASVRWTDIDYKRGCIVLAKHKTARTGKPRTIILHPVVVKLLLWIRRHEPDPVLVFVNAKGTAWKRPALCWRVKELREAADVPPDATLYCCRHAFGTQAVLNGVDLMTLAALMGHADISTTQIYVTLAGQTDHLKAAVGKIFKH